MSESLQVQKEDLKSQVTTNLFANKETMRSNTLTYRKQKVFQFRNLLIDNMHRIVESISKDCQKPEIEIIMMEVTTLLSLINFLGKNLKKSLKPYFVKTPLQLWGTRGKVYPTPKGSVLVIAPWNYPFHLAIYPALTAFAAGNNVCIKPSEHTPHTAKLIADLMGEVFDQSEIMVVEGGVERTQELLALPFDHMFFTGSPRVGSIIMEAAAKVHASVTLELGGKSPVVIGDNVDFKDAAEKIMWGKFANSGQTCVAPDYILVTAKNKDRLITELVNTAKHFQTKMMDKNSTHYSNIINQQRTQHLKKLLDQAVHEGATIVYGGESDIQACHFSPTFLTGVGENMQVMQEEIFGPILPIVEFQDFESMLRYINEKEHPLALYYFGKSVVQIKQLIDATQSGGVSVNEVMLTAGHPHMPFGGIGTSGIGKYHGIYGINEFVHHRSVLIRKRNLGFKLLYPPYFTKQVELLKLIMRHFKSWI